jgi:hypothetical protein
MITWPARRNAPPPSAAAIILQIEDLKRAAVSRQADILAGEALLSEFAGDPAGMLQIEGRLETLRHEDEVARRTLAHLENALPAAEQRTKLAEFEERKRQRSRASARLARNLEERYNAAAEQLSSVLAEMAADADACQRLNTEAADLGQVGLHSAEFMLRKDCRTGAVGFETLTAMKIPSWDGGFGYPLR